MVSKQLILIALVPFFKYSSFSCCFYSYLFFCNYLSGIFCIVNLFGLYVSEANINDFFSFLGFVVREMSSSNTQMEVHYINTGFPYTVTESFMDLFEGLTYAQADAALPETLHDQVA